MKQTLFKIQPKKQIAKKPLACASCGLYKNCKNPKIKPYGQNKLSILNIGEAPGETEDNKGRPWQGEVGEFLKKEYERIGIDLFEDCLNTNAVNCRPVNNATPTNYQIDCCKNIMVEPTMEQNAPKIIVLFGNAALYSFLGQRWHRDLSTIRHWRGFSIPDQDYNAWVIPLWHPSFVTRARDREAIAIWRQDLQLIKTHLERKFLRYKNPTIHIIDDLSILEEVVTNTIAIDFETTGLKPQQIGHRIVSAAVAIDENTVYAFLMPKTKRERQPLINILENRMITKLGHNIKYEDTWARERLKCIINNWGFDTMLASHLLDNRQGVTSLKFQTYVRLGIIDYESEISNYLKSVNSKNGNSKNTIMELTQQEFSVEQLLKYNALDSIHTYRIAMQQIKEIDYDFLPF